MRNISQSPVYNLKVVLKETNLTADVLRAWERRYDLPKPQRTPGGHRLYSEYDIETLKWLKARQTEGLSISRAVELWRDIVASGNDPLENLPLAAVSTAPQEPSAPARIDTMRRDWLQAALSFDGDRAEDVLNQAFAMYSPEMVCAEILQKGLNSIGEDWFQNKVTVQQEHFASALAVRRLDTLITFTPRSTHTKTVVLGCPPGERHTIPLLMLSLLIRRKGLNVVYLGADIPEERLVETAAMIHPDLIVLAAQQLTTAAALQSAMVALEKTGISLAYGGLIFNRVPALRQHIPAHFLGETLEESVVFIERLAFEPIRLPEGVRVNPSYRELAHRYQEKRPMIEAEVNDHLKKNSLPLENFAEANNFLGMGLFAALQLGNPAFLEPDLEWVKQLLAARRIAASQFLPFMTLYSQALQEQMGASGAPITAWFNAYIL